MTAWLLECPGFIPSYLGPCGMTYSPFKALKYATCGDAERAADKRLLQFPGLYPSEHFFAEGW